MIVIDCEKGFWFLFKNNESYYLDVNVCLGLVDISISIELNEMEITAYLRNGKSAIDKIAQEINSKQSAEHPRNVKNFDEKYNIIEIINDWRKSID